MNRCTEDEKNARVALSGGTAETGIFKANLFEDDLRVAI